MDEVDEREGSLDEVVGGRYRLIDKVGSGGMAVVYVAEDAVLGRKVAVKRLHADSPAHAARRFLREAKLAAALSHPNLVTVFDAFPDASNLVIVMEYIDGPDLAEALEPGPLEEGRALEVLGDVGAALDHIHERGIVHRDVKPSNVLLAPDGRARLTDLGIARVVEETSTTQANMVVGSAPYMAPEQLAGEQVGPPADVYALALTAYEALSGERARTGLPAAISYQAAMRPPPDIRDVRPSTPGPVADVLRHGLARSPRERPATCGDFVNELSAALRPAPRHRRAAAVPTDVFAATPAAETQPAPRRETASREVEPLGAPSPVAVSTPLPRKERRSLPPRAIALGALIALALAVVAITSLGDGDPEPASPPRSPAAASGKAAGSGQGGGSRSDSAKGAVTAAPGSPAAAVETFYERAAAHDFEGAAAVTSANLQAGFPGGFAGTFATLQSIEFTRLRTVARSASTAEVELATVATHTDRVDTCSGTVSLVSVGGKWLVDQLTNIACQ